MGEVGVVDRYVVPFLYFFYRKIQTSPPKKVGLTTSLTPCIYINKPSNVLIKICIVYGLLKHILVEFPAPSLYRVLCTHQRSKKHEIRG